MNILEIVLSYLGCFMVGGILSFLLCCILTVAKISDLQDKYQRASEENEILRSENDRLANSDCKGKCLDEKA